MQKFLILVMAVLVTLPTASFAASSEEAMMAELQKQIADLSEELEELNDRLDDAERHSTLDRIEFSGDLRYDAHSLHYQDVTYYPGINVDFTDFAMKAMQPYDPNDLPNSGFGGFDTFDPINGIFIPNADTPLAGMFEMLGSMPAEQQQTIINSLLAGGVGVYPMALKSTSDINNDVMQTLRLRLNMKAKVANNVKFSGRLSMFKNFGDSTGVQVFDSWNRFTMDATNSTNTTGDMLRVDRAYFDWSNIGGTGVYLSIGRRPSTGGPPLHYRDNELRGGTPTGNVMSLNFDGITIGKHFENIGLEGFTARFCYGQGYESEWGNGEMFNDLERTKDTHFAGFNVDILNDGTNFLQITAFRAMNLNDGFKGLIAFPTQYAMLFAPTMYQDLQNFPNFNFVTRVQPSTTIGDVDLGGIVFSRTEENGINWFVSGGMTVLRPNGEVGMFGGMGSDPVYTAGLSDDGTQIVMNRTAATNADDEEGYGFYVGVQVPAPMGKFGLEYNYGSQWWTPFNQAVDDPIGSKLMTRGHAGEAYYIFDINPNMFIRLSGIYYDFEYTGSGSPVGRPQKVDDVKAGTAVSLLPVVDTAYDMNATFNLKF